jgi:hypothetical protein
MFFLPFNSQPFDPAIQRLDNELCRAPPGAPVRNQGKPLSKLLSEDERVQMAQFVSGILAEWRLTPEESLSLLGMPEGTKPRELSRFKRGTPLPPDETIISHAEHILGIQESLHMIYPRNRNMPLFWLTHRNKQLGGIPLRIMLDDGLHGMSRVWGILDCTQNWKQ